MKIVIWILLVMKWLQGYYPVSHCTFKLNILVFPRKRMKDFLLFFCIDSHHSISKNLDRALQ